ncbi:MAG: DUF1015 family protein [Elusimicrobiota bacterium]
MKRRNTDTVILGFAGVRLHPEAVRGQETLSLPYDCLTPVIDRSLRRHPDNAIHFEEPHGKYAVAKRSWNRLKASGRLLADTTSYYLLVERVGKVRRVGLLALLDLAKTAHIWPHEQTFDKYVNERKEHLSRSGLNLSPIFLIAEDRRRRLLDVLDGLYHQRQRLPLAGAHPRNSFDGTKRDLYLVDEEPWFSRVQAALAPDAGFLVADGHHRFKAALTLRRAGRIRHALCYVTSSRSNVSILRKHPPVPGLDNTGPDALLRNRKWTLSQVVAWAKSGKLLPKKTTYFYPKVPVGLVYYDGR